MADTIDAQTGQVISDAQPQTAQPIYRPIGMGVPSLINIPPQIAVTAFWVAIGFALCWWLTNRKST